MYCMFITTTTKHATFFAVFAATAMFVAEPTFATERMLPGQYQTIAVTADGKSRTVTSCFTPEDAKTTNDDVKVGRADMEKATQKAGNGVCKITDYNFVGDTQTTKMVCSGNTTTTVRQTFRGNNAGDSQTTITRGGKTVQEINSTYKRIGACK